jgi:ribosomal protein L34E
MGFLINCDNKGCYKESEALLDKSTKNVHCNECGEVIKNITIFAKKQLESIGQVKRHNSNQAYALHCKNCNKKAVPKLVDDKFCCSLCDCKIEVPAPFQKILRDNLSQLPSARG